MNRGGILLIIHIHTKLIITTRILLRLENVNKRTPIRKL